MSSTNIISFGKYKGKTFQELLEHDINYCKFINRCPENNAIESFKQFLDEKLEQFIEQKDRESLKKTLEKL